MARQKVEICLKKKKPTRAQIFRYFRIESRNNNKLLEIGSFSQYQQNSRVYAKNSNSSQKAKNVNMIVWSRIPWCWTLYQDSIDIIRHQNWFLGIVHIK